MKLYAFHCGGEMRLGGTESPFSELVGTKVYLPTSSTCRAPLRERHVRHRRPPGPRTTHRPQGRLGDEADTGRFLLREDDTSRRSSPRSAHAPRIGHVIVSHLHYDNCGRNENFPHATIRAAG